VINNKILITGGSGFLGRNVCKLLKNNNYNIISLGSKECDLTDYNSVNDLFNYYKPQIVIHLAASVGGIGANKDNPGSFFYNNMSMGLNVIENSRLCGVKKIIMVGTVCSYPKYTPTPFKENDFWSGYPEETNAPYGIAKKSLMVMLKAYKEQYNLQSVCLVPCNLYGPEDNFNPKTSHVIPALIKKFVDAKRKDDSVVKVWGDGTATREFLYVSDAAEAIVKSLYIDIDEDFINIGSGTEISIKSLVNKVANLVGFNGTVEYENDKPNGQPRRLIDSSKAYGKLGWKSLVNFDTGLKNTIDWYVKNLKS
jgi:GDP-L-fucose synthase